MNSRAILVSCLLAVPAQCQRLAIKAYTTADGLSHNSIHRILRDSRGFIWFATAEGLSRFDGYGFTTYGTAQGLPNPHVYSILETRAGVLWIGTGGGLCRFASGRFNAPSSSVFSTYPLVPGARPVVRALAEGRDGTLWIGTSSGLWRSAGQPGATSFERVKLELSHMDQLGVLALLEDSFQTLWIGTGTDLYRRSTDGRIGRYADITQGPFMAVRDGGHGRILIATGHGLLICTPDPVSWSVERLWNRDQGLLGDYFTDAAPATGGGAWVVSVDGISRVPPLISSNKMSPNKARALAARADIGDFPPESVAEDRAGNVWVGSDGGGAFRIATDGLVSYSEREGLGSHDVLSVFEDAGGQLLAVSRSRKGLFLSRLVGERFEAIRLNVGPRPIFGIWHGRYEVTAAGADGEWWVATHRGLARFSGIREISELPRASPRYELAGENIFRLFPDRRGNIWISLQHGPHTVLMRWNCQNQRIERFPDSTGGPRLINDRVQAYSEDRSGQVWMGLEHGGLWRTCPPGFCRYDLPKEMLESAINWLHTDKAGRIWIGSSDAGAARIDEPADHNRKLVRYTTKEGLSSNEILCVTEDLSGNIYLCTARGVDRLDPETGRVRHFTTADGLAPGELQTAFRDRTGSLWFGAQQGVSRLIPAPSAASEAPPVAITAVSTGGVSVPISPSGETEVLLQDLPPGRDQVQVEFVGLGFRAGEVLRYQYSLQGGTNQWSDLTTQRAVTYADLRPGSYRFLVRSVNSDGLMTPHPASVQFTILRPIWMRWWFVSIALTALALVIGSVWRYRQKQLAAVRGIRMRITADLHDDIGSSLSQIAILSELARQDTANKTQDRIPRLDHIADLSRELIDSMSDIVWATDPSHDRLGDLAQHMREFAGEVLGGSNIEFRFVTSGIEPDLKLNVNVRRQIFLVFKESIHNLIRHSRCAKAEASLERDGSWLSLLVRDNGIGFDASHDFEGHGLASMRERARTLSGQIECISGPDGTTVCLRVPLRP